MLAIKSISGQERSYTTDRRSGSCGRSTIAGLSTRVLVCRVALERLRQIY